MFSYCGSKTIDHVNPDLNVRCLFIYLFILGKQMCDVQIRRKRSICLAIDVSPTKIYYSRFSYNVLSKLEVYDDNELEDYARVGLMRANILIFLRKKRYLIRKTLTI